MENRAELILCCIGLYAIGFFIGVSI